MKLAQFTKRATGIQRVLTVLNKAADDDYFTTAELAKLARVKNNIIKEGCYSGGRLKGWYILDGQRRLFGNRQALRQLIKLLGRA